MAAVLRFLIFPRGRMYSAPSDKLGHEIAELICTPSAARARLTQNTYINDVKSPVGMFAEALDLSLKMEAVEKKIHTAIRNGELQVPPGVSQMAAARDAGIINKSELQQLERLEILTTEICAVDDFAPDELGTKPFPPTHTTRS